MAPVHAHRPARIALLLLALVLAAPAAARAPSAAAPAPAPAPSVPCTAGDPPRVRLVALKVQVLDAGGHPVDALVEVDGLAAGPTNHTLHVPVCAARLRVQSGGLVFGRALALRDGELNLVQGRLGEEPTPPVAAAAAAAPTAAAPLKKLPPRALPAGKVALHYHRPDGKYEGWGLHTWETLDGNRSRPLEGVTWGTPLDPSGEDAFGVYWLLPAKEFRNGQVNFILHVSGERECEEDQVFQLKHVKEAWVVSGVCRVFASAEAARNAAR